MSLTRREALLRISGMALAALLPGCRQPDPDGHPLTGVRLPPFALPAPDGRMHRSSDYAGSPLLVNFWATWCLPCRTEMPDLDALYRRFAPRGFRVLGISVDGDVNLVREYLLKNPVGFPILLDEQQRLARETLRVEAYPTSFLVGRNGMILEVVSGIRPWADETYANELAQRLKI